MKSDLFSEAGLHAAHCSRIRQLPQVRGVTLPIAGSSTLNPFMKNSLVKVSPVLQLAAAQTRPRRIASPFVPRNALCAGKREVLAKLRAAELAAWVASGGDYLRGSFSE
jgi:hypothetical protein